VARLAHQTAHAYYHTRSIASSAVNLVRAARQILDYTSRDVEDPLFLTGFSQGGHASYAAHRLIENDPSIPWKLTGTAGIAGPLDLAGTGLPARLEGKSRFSSLYPNWIALSYSRVYGHPLNDVIREPWASNSVALFAGNNDGAPIISALPKDPRELLAESATTAILHSEPHWFKDRLAENSILDWQPHIPVRAWNVTRDDDVPRSDILALAEAAQAHGFNFSAADLGAFNHDESILAAAPQVLRWFERLRESR